MPTMFGIKTLDLHCDRQRPVYYAGDMLELTVFLETIKDMRVQDVNFIVTGSSSVLMNKPQSPQYTKLHLQVSGKIFQEFETGDGSMLIPKGLHTTKLNYRIPDNCPGSFLAVRGAVIYMMKCVVKIQDGKQVFSQLPINFNIYENVDLNQLLYNKKMATELSTSVMISKPCCRTGEVEAYIKLDKPGYVPGEEIHITGEITNKGDTQLKHVYTALIQKIGYYGQGHKALWQREVARGNMNVTNVTRGVTINDVIVVPDVAMTTFHPDAIIVLKYVIQLKMKPSKTPMELDVTIGSWPLLTEHDADRFDPTTRVVPKMSIPNRFAMIRITPTSDPRAGQKMGYLKNSRQPIRARWPH